jgi:hypothetical protein
LNPEAPRDGLDRRSDFVALEIGEPMAGIQEHGDFAFMASSHSSAAT